MRRLREEFRKFWRIFSFADKVAAVVTFIGVGVFSVSILFAVTAYREDKESYLFELQMIRARSAATQLRGALTELRSSSRVIAVGSSLPNSSNLGIPRLPEGDEIFVADSKKLVEFVESGSSTQSASEVDPQAKNQTSAFSPL
jgi:hypothetical protein